mmetsp:Transcript_6103/g.17487  ORF Transcript_6103/g.17487 Transcript_6103/m.17487 type:complete len:91 (-) Transcript_6103:1817-2089(-)
MWVSRSLFALPLLWSHSCARIPHPPSLRNQRPQHASRRLQVSEGMEISNDTARAGLDYSNDFRHLKLTVQDIDANIATQVPPRCRWWRPP